MSLYWFYSTSTPIQALVLTRVTLKEPEAIAIKIQAALKATCYFSLNKTVMADHELHFSSQSTSEAGSFKLLELPPELCALIEQSIKDGFPAR